MLDLTSDRPIRVGRLLSRGLDQFIGQLDGHAHRHLPRDNRLSLSQSRPQATQVVKWRHVHWRAYPLRHHAHTSSTRDFESAVNRFWKSASHSSLVELVAISGSGDT